MNPSGPSTAPQDPNQQNRKSGSLKPSSTPNGTLNGVNKEANATSEEEQDKMRVHDLNMQLEENNDEIMRNKDEINNLKI